MNAAYLTVKIVVTSSLDETDFNKVILLVEASFPEDRSSLIVRSIDKKKKLNN